MATRPTTLACLWLAVAVATTAQDNPPSSPQQPTFRTGIQSVRVDLYATKDGKPVTDLRREEIELFEDGAPQNIQTFEHVTFAPRTDIAPAEPRSIGESRKLATDPRSRLFVVVVPVFARNAAFFAGPLVRERFPLIGQLNGLLGPDDLVAVMTPDMRLDDLTFRRRLALSNSAWFPSLEADPKYSLWDACYPPALPGSPNNEMKARYQELMTFEALDALIAHLGTLREERKHVLVLTTGFRLYTKNPNLGARMRTGMPPGIPTGGPMPMGVVPRLGDTVGGMGPSSRCERDLLDLASLDHSNRLEEIAAHARLNNVSFYPISPGSLSTTPSGRAFRGPFTNATPFERQSALRGLAEHTDGLAIIDTGNIEGSLKKMMTATSAYYLLSYSPTNTAADGKFRRIAVKVKRSNTQIRARPGYVAATPPEARPAPIETSKPPDLVSSAVRALDTGSSDVLHLRSVSWMRSAGAGSPAGALWVIGELDPEIRFKAPWTSGASAQITLRPVGGGAPISRTADLTAATAVVEFEFTGDAQLAPGTYAMQMELIAADGEPLGDFMRVTMPREPTPLGDPIVARRTTAPGQRYVRTADSRFRRNELIRFEVPTTASEPVSARLLDSRGSVVAVPPQTSERADPSGAFRWIVVDFPLAPLAPAYYAVEVKQGSASRLTAFRVVP